MYPRAIAPMSERRPPRLRERAAVWLCGLAAALPALGATDIANAPIPTTEFSAKPNIMLVLDNSESMQSDFLPEEMGDMSITNILSSYGYRSPQCNGVVYDPANAYPPPLKPDGSAYPNANFGAALSDGYDSASATASLNNSYYYRYTGSQPKLGWTYTLSGVDKSTTFYKECLSIAGNAPGSGVFTKVVVTSTSSDAQKYANWYSYYRTRILAMRSAAGRVFQGLDASYRVGFSVINEPAGTASYKSFLDIADFTYSATGTNQKSDFFGSLYGIPTLGGTPLRPAVSRIGQYFANKMSGQKSDPVQYACQRNYAIVATDGAWNAGPGTQLDGSTPVGQQDGGEVRPMFDGNHSISTTIKNYRAWKWSKGAQGSGGCDPSSYPVTVQQVDWSTTTRTMDGIAAPAFGEFSPMVMGSSSTQCYSSTDLSAAGLDGSLTMYSSSPTSYVSSPNSIVTIVGPTITSGGPGDTLSDVTEYYYKTDLRSPALGNCTGAPDLAAGTLGGQVCKDGVPPNGRDSAAWQHMTTYTIGFGLRGTLPYDPNYLTQTTGSYAQITAGTLDWPAPNVEVAKIDDLWHAAVNGRGRYFSAGSAKLLSDALATALSDTKNVDGAGTAVAVSSQKPVAGGNDQGFVASYTTNAWKGDVIAYPLSATTGAIDTSKPNWSAQARLNAKTASTRTIYYARSSSGLVPFTYTSLGTDYPGVFDNFCGKANVPAQCASLSAAQKTLASGANLVAYLRGDPSNEIATNSSNPLYRSRGGNKLGDIIDAAPAYVGKSAFSYVDTGYADFAAKTATRLPVVYAAANDGMLHAFSAASTTVNGVAPGDELWAYVPGPLMSKLYRLADSAYPTHHQYYVDGTPVAGDVVDGNGNWKTILVGGLGAGGTGYYALDVTDPANPKRLWEFSDANLGLSFGNPVITKLQNGKWAVALSSGYNNNDGLGHLFVLDANSGAKLLDLKTSAGSPANPSGLAKISAWVDNPANNTALRFYGGDLLGNLWRFDVDGSDPPKGSVTLLAMLQINGTPQPITTAPQPVSISTKLPAVAVGTGRYLAASDVNDSTQQSLYVVKDTLTSTGLGDVRAGGHLVDRPVTASSSTTDPTKLAASSVDWSKDAGWKIDLPTQGERVAIDPMVQGNAIVAFSALPSADACKFGGSSWMYQLDLSNGSGSSVKLGDTLVMGVVAVTVRGSGTGGTGTGSGTGGTGSGPGTTGTGNGSGAAGTDSEKTVYDTHDHLNQLDQQQGPAGPAASPTLRRTSWRELVN